MTNPFSGGHFAPVTEEITAFDLPVTGRIPAELTGRYLRNGPNALGVEDPAAHNFALGEGMVHGVRLRDGRAEWYRNRWVRSSDVAKRLGEPYKGTPPEIDHAASIHVIGHAGRTLALMEGGAPTYELGYELDTVGICDFGGNFSEGFTAHTKYDRARGELHGVAYNPMWDHLRHIVIDSTGRASRTTNIAVPDAPLVHDFALTENHVVVYDLPIIFDMDLAMSGDAVPYIWNPAHQARVGVMPRGGGDVKWLEIEPCFVFHTLNAHDADGSVVVDLITYERFDVREPDLADPPALDRWTIDPAAGTVRRQRLDDRPQEFPRVNEALVSLPNRYGYTAVAANLAPSVAGDVPDEFFTNALIKHDLIGGTSEINVFGDDTAVGEAVFAPRVDGGPEDDGYVMAYAHNPDRGAADLVILAAQDFTGAPVARVHLPARVPLGFHGSWIPDLY